ncbi:hypothetical protein QJS10_CPA05g00742 [Acorus calamus]|uniref:Uncharacterized protein n=1 Tax=Acorus calamus TaxID=4465 RepID=A0AAV9ETT8_ACOCL|nr:hypothetical protein QJS10_CPA05g00742 [Acorus calamus]
MLLDSPAFSSQQTSSWSDHSAHVAAAMEENASKKRAPNGLPPSHPHPKLPRGNSARPRNVPDTLGGALVPPQLKGRSNVVTEDINKLFVRRKSADPSC